MEDFDWPDGEECPECRGSGMIVVDHPRYHDLEQTCPACGGSGFVEILELDPDD